MKKIIILLLGVAVIASAPLAAAQTTNSQQAPSLINQKSLPAVGQQDKSGQVPSVQQQVKSIIGQQDPSVPFSINLPVSDTQDVVRSVRQRTIQSVDKIKDSFAEDSKSLRQTIQGQAESVREGLQNSLRQIQQNTELAPQAAQEAVLRVRKEARQTIENRIEETKSEIISNREEFRSEIQERRQEAEVLVRENRQELQERIQTIQEERKRNIILNFAERIESLNTRLTDRMANVLNNIEVVLEGVISRTEKAAVDGKDVSGVRNAIAEAQEDIATARSYIVNQAATTYAIDGNLIEESLGSELSYIRDTLKGDLQVIRDEIIKAKESIAEAAMLLGRIQGIDKLDIEIEE